MSDKYWTTVSPSEFAHEQEALQYIRERLPDHSPYCAWSNFEFSGHDGRLYEVDLLVFSKVGVYLVEIKSYSGQLIIDQNQWVHHSRTGRQRTEDNPRRLANQKAKVLAGLLRRFGGWGDSYPPFIEAVIFLSKPNVDVRFRGYGGEQGVFCHEDVTSMPDITSALLRADGPGLRRASQLDRPLMKKFVAAMSYVGIRPTRRQTMVGDYELGQLIEEGPRYQDYLGKHPTTGAKRRIRVFSNPRDASLESRKQALAAAKREFRMLEAMRHPGILEVKAFKEPDRGPALLFEAPDEMVRLDQFVTNKPNLGAIDRLRILRAIAEAVQYAHSRRIIHRSLCPQNVLINESFPEGPLEIRVFNWHTGRQDDGTSKGTVHVMDFAGDARHLYLAPEVLTDPDKASEKADVYGLGTLGYFLFTALPPGETLSDLYDKLQRQGGLRLSIVLDSVRNELDDLVFKSTQGVATKRMPSANNFAAQLDSVERAFTEPEPDEIPDPLMAKPGDRLGDRFTVEKRLGKGSTALALLVQDEAENRQVVLKIATDRENAERLQRESKELEKVSHPYVVSVYEVLDIEGRTALVLECAGERSLRDRLRDEGHLSLDELRRYGEDLLEVLEAFEAAGISHRDIKPANLGIGEPIAKQASHLMIFDFSLAGTSPDLISVGTPAYRDPFLRHPLRSRWDDHADRYSAAMTLHEMATGRLPVWGEDESDPVLDDGAELQLAIERLPGPVRAGLETFFKRALHRDIRQRFDNAEEMRHRWIRVFEGTRHTEHEESGDLAELLKQIVPSKPVRELGLSELAADALDRIDILTIDDLIRAAPKEIHFIKGVGGETRKELVRVFRLAQEHFPTFAEKDEGPTDFARLSIERLLDYVCGPKKRSGLDEPERVFPRAFLGLDETEPRFPWPSHNELAQSLGVTADELQSKLTDTFARWESKRFAEPLLADARSLLVRHDGVMTDLELAQSLLALRGSLLEGNVERMRAASAVARIAFELEQRQDKPAYCPIRIKKTLFLARSSELVEVLRDLGEYADALADEFPPPPASRVVSELGDFLTEERECVFSRHRLVSIAVDASEKAALSPRGEIYAKHLPARQALRLAAGALSMSVELSEEALRRRVADRYPLAERLPTRPALDTLLREADIPFRYDSQAGDGGAYVSTMAQGPHLATSFASTATFATIGPPTEAEQERLAFDACLRNAQERGGFMALMTDLRSVSEAVDKLHTDFSLDVVSVEEVWLRHMLALAERDGVALDVVFEADRPGADSYDKRQLASFMDDVGRLVGEELTSRDAAYLLVNVGPCARYNAMGVIDGLRQNTGKPGHPPLVWLVLPVDQQKTQPTIDGVVLPTIDPSERVRIPRRWL